MPASVARDSALMGLNVKLPQSLSQISERMSLSTGACKPPLTKHSDTRATRSLDVPSGSPTGNRLPSTCLMTPGDTNSAAGYPTHPMTRSHGIHSEINPLGSISECIPCGRVIGCVVYPAAELVSPGVIKH